MKKQVFGLVALVSLAVGALKAEPIQWGSQAQKLGHVDVIDLSWGLERTLGVTRAASEFVQPIELIYNSKDESAGMFGPQWRSPQLESRLVLKDARVLEWRTPWGAVIALCQEEGTRRFQDYAHEWTAYHQGNLRYILARKDRWQFVYDKGYLQETTSPGGRKLLYRYQGKNLLSSIVQVGPQGGAEWPLVQIQADPATGRVRSIQIAGVENQFTFAQVVPDEPLRLASWSQGNAPAAKFDYGTYGQLRSVTSPGGHKEAFTVDFEKEKDPAIKPVANTRMVAGQVGTPASPAVAAVKDSVLRSDGTLKYQYATGTHTKHPLYGRGVTVQDSLGRSQNVNFARQRGILTITDATGQTSTVKYYRQLGLRYDYKVRQIKNPQGQVLVENKYNQDGNLIGSRDLLGNITQYTLDGNGRVVRVDRVVGGKGEAEMVVGLQRDANGNVVRVVNTLHQASELRYTATGEVAVITDLDGFKSEITYDSRGFVTSIKDSAGRVQKVEYDSYGRPVRSISPDGIVSESILDDRGLVVEVKQLLPNQPKDQAITVVRRNFDADGRLVAMTDVLGRTSRNEFNPDGSLAASINPAGTATRYVRDGAQQLVAFWMEKGSTRGSRVASDGSSDALSDSDAVARMGRVDFERDVLGRLVKQTNAIGQETTWSFDQVGRLAEKNTGAQVVKYTYNKLGQTMAVDYGQGNVVKYERDALGRIAAVCTPTSVARYTFDKLGRVTQVAMVRGERKAVLQYGYTPSGKKAFVAWSDTGGGAHAARVSSGGGSPTDGIQGIRSGRTDYLYSPEGNLAELRSNGKMVAKYLYSGRGLLSEKQMADGTRIVYGNDPLGRIASMKVISAKGKTLTDLKYTWDAAGQLTRRTWDGVEQQYAYDSAGQLVAVTSSDPQKLPSERYVFDLAGNMTEKTVGDIRTKMSYDTANRLLASATEKQAGSGEQVAFKYDNAGRLIAQTIGKETTRYQYGLFEKTSGVIKPDGKRVGFDYWPDGQISAKGTLPPMLAEKENSESAEDGEPTVASFLNGIRESKSEIASDRFKETETMLWDGLALVQRGDDVFSVEPHVSGGVPVANGNQIVINDFLGTTLGTVQGETFTPAPATSFGEALAANGGSQPRFYTGKPWDTDLQAYNFLFRNYQPQMTRWMVADPSGWPDGGNNFAYAPVPTSQTDCLGLFVNGTDYSIVDPGVPWYIPQTRTPGGLMGDVALARGAGFLGFPAGSLSDRLVNYCIAGTTATISNYSVTADDIAAIVADAEFDKVRAAVNKAVADKKGQTTTINLSVDLVFNSGDLATSIHRVTMKISGRVFPRLDGGEWKYHDSLQVTFSDLYDFDPNDNDWHVRVFGRLYVNGWLSKFSTVGNWSQVFEGSFPE